MGLGRKANQVIAVAKPSVICCQSFSGVFYFLFPSLIYFNMLLAFSLSQVYIIDFGLAKRYRDATTNRHIPYRQLPRSMAINFCLLLLMLSFFFFITCSFILELYNFDPFCSNYLESHVCICLILIFFLLLSL